MPESNVAIKLEAWADAVGELLDWCYSNEVAWDYDEDLDQYDESIPDNVNTAITAMRLLARRFREGVEGTAQYEQIAQEAHSQTQVPPPLRRLDEPTPDTGPQRAGLLEFIQSTGGIHIREGNSEALTQQAWYEAMSRLSNLPTIEAEFVRAEHARVDAEMQAEMRELTTELQAEMQAFNEEEEGGENQ